MTNKDKGDGLEDSPLVMLLVILLEGASMEVSWVVTPSSYKLSWLSENDEVKVDKQVLITFSIGTYKDEGTSLIVD